MKKRVPRRRYPKQSESTRYAVYVYYKGPQGSFDEALRVFARRNGMGFGGSGCWLVGKGAGTRDISFCCGTWAQARAFLEDVRLRFKVRAKLVDQRAKPRRRLTVGTPRKWRVMYQVAPWPSKTRSVTVVAATACGARGLALQRIAQEHGKRDARGRQRVARVRLLRRVRRGPVLTRKERP